MAAYGRIRVKQCQEERRGAPLGFRARRAAQYGRFVLDAGLLWITLCVGEGRL